VAEGTDLNNGATELTEVTEKLTLVPQMRGPTLGARIARARVGEHVDQPSGNPSVCSVCSVAPF